jgi:predicted DNA-binding transcriptional regulator AlpA
MTMLWKCPNADCLPTEIEPKDVEEVETAESWLSADEVGEFLGVPITTVYTWNKNRTGPAYVSIGKHLRYSKGDVLIWLSKQNGDWAVCSSQCGRPYPRSKFKPVEG